MRKRLQKGALRVYRNKTLSKRVIVHLFEINSPKQDIMIQTELHTDVSLLDERSIAAVHQYDCIVDGFVIWETKFSDDKDADGNFNRYISWGPFAELVRFLENINLMDNKIAVEYNNGLFIGFYDGKVIVGTKVRHFSDHPWIKRDVHQRYKEYEQKRKGGPR